MKVLEKMAIDRLEVADDSVRTSILSSLMNSQDRDTTPTPRAGPSTHPATSQAPAAARSLSVQDLNVASHASSGLSASTVQSFVGALQKPGIAQLLVDMVSRVPKVIRFVVLIAYCMWPRTGGSSGEMQNGPRKQQYWGKKC